MTLLTYLIMKLFMFGGKYFSTHALVRLALVLQYFPPQVIISLPHKQSHDNSIIFLYFIMKVLDNFHSPPMIMAPWGWSMEIHSTLGSYNRRKIIQFQITYNTRRNIFIHNSNICNIGTARK